LYELSKFSWVSIPIPAVVTDVLGRGEGYLSLGLPVFTSDVTTMVVMVGLKMPTGMMGHVECWKGAE